MLNAERIFIEPTTKEAHIIARWLDSDNPRGFFLPDRTMLVFSGYGNTHDSMRRFFSLPRIENPFIHQRDGSVFFDFSATSGPRFLRENMLVEKLRWLTDAQKHYFNAVARLRGADKALINLDPV